MLSIWTLVDITSHPWLVLGKAVESVKHWNPAVHLKHMENQKKHVRIATMFGGRRRLHLGEKDLSLRWPAEEASH